MKGSKMLLIFTLLLAASNAGVLQSDQKPVHENKSRELEAPGPIGKDDVPSLTSAWKYTGAQDTKDIDTDELAEFLPVVSNDAKIEYEKISEFHLGYEDEDATESPDEEPTTPSAATLCNIISCQLLILYAIVVAIASFRSF